MDRETDVPRIHSVDEAAAILGISRGLAYQQARAFIESEGERGIPAIKIGARYLIPDDALRQFLTIDLTGRRPATGADRASPAA
jgi:excisionase family DNA binding protein